MILVIPFTVKKDRYQDGKLIERKGDKVVSHGINEITGKTVILPCDPWDQFVSMHCMRYGDEYYLKE